MGNDIQTYLSAALDMETNIYVQQKMLEKVKKDYQGLGLRSKIYKPVRQKADFDIVIAMMPIFAVIGGIIGGIIGLVGGFNNYREESILLALFSSALCAVVFAVIGAIVGGVAVGGIVGFSARLFEQKKLDTSYQLECAIYEELVTEDDQRIQAELKKQRLLGNVIKQIENGLHQSQCNLKKLYSLSVLHKDYQNKYAVSSMYGYFEKGITQSLAFDPHTGDEGAYKIYERELREDIIITNTEEILNKLDIVIRNQYVLANQLENAQRSIEALYTKINHFAVRFEQKTDRLIECAEITAYNSERAARELSFLNWATVIYLS